MGEIGRDRWEYLYEMSYCDILLIQRGYYRRNVLQYQLQRLQAFGAFHCMGGAKKDPEEWLPLYLDRYITDDDPMLPSKEQMAEMLAEIDAINAQRNAEQKSSEE